MIATKNPWKILAYFNKYDFFNYLCPFVFTVEPDLKNSKKFISTLQPHQFILLDLAVYYDDGTDKNYKRTYTNKFKKFGYLLDMLFICILLIFILLNILL